MKGYMGNPGREPLSPKFWDENIPVSPQEKLGKRRSVDLEWLCRNICRGFTKSYARKDAERIHESTGHILLSKRRIEGQI
jgi:hypothetical protein